MCFSGLFKTVKTTKTHVIRPKSLPMWGPGLEYLHGTILLINWLVDVIGCFCASAAPPPPHLIGSINVPLSLSYDLLYDFYIFLI